VICSFRTAWRKWRGVKDVTALQHSHPLRLFPSRALLMPAACSRSYVDRMPQTWPIPNNFILSNALIPPLSGVF